MTQMIISDFDRTLVREDGTISERSKNAINSIKKRGILFGIATGRNNENITQALKKHGIYDFCDLIISANGAETLDMKTHEVTKGHWLSKDTIVKISEHFKTRDNIVYFLESHSKILTQKDNISVSRISKGMKLEVEYLDINEIENMDYPKVLFSVNDEDRPWMDDFLGRHQNIYGAYGFSTHKDIYEFVDVRVSKYKAIETYCHKNDIAIANVLSFGDSNNDLEMIEKTGRGVAVKNASPEALKVSDYITLSHNEDGVAHYIERYVLGE